MKVFNDYFTSFPYLETDKCILRSFKRSDMVCVIGVIIECIRDLVSKLKT